MSGSYEQSLVDGYRQMREESADTDALLHDIEMGLDRHFTADLYVPGARAALDSLAAELEAEKKFHDLYRGQVDDLNAELERVKAERDAAQVALVADTLGTKARLDKARNALQQTRMEVDLPDHIAEIIGEALEETE